MINAEALLNFLMGINLPASSFLAVFFYYYLELVGEYKHEF